MHCQKGLSVGSSACLVTRMPGEVDAGLFALKSPRGVQHTGFNESSPLG